MIKLLIQAVSDVGLKRTNNEDLVLVNKNFVRDNELKTEITIENEIEPVLIAVADGMGGHNAGELASELLLQKLSGIVHQNALPLSFDELKNFFNREVTLIHQSLIYEGINDSSKIGMGSTLIALLFLNGNVYYINAGDSRLYRFRSGMLKQLSRDHSLAEATGQDRNSSHILLNSVGGGENVFIDFVDISDIVIKEDAFLLCSDGLSDLVTDESIEVLLNDTFSVEELVLAAKNAGGKDNISIVLMKYLNN